MIVGVSSLLETRIGEFERKGVDRCAVGKSGVGLIFTSVNSTSSGVFLGPPGRAQNPVKSRKDLPWVSRIRKKGEKVRFGKLL